MSQIMSKYYSFQKVGEIPKLDKWSPLDMARYSPEEKVSLIGSISLVKDQELTFADIRQKLDGLDLFNCGFEHEDMGDAIWTDTASYKFRSCKIRCRNLGCGHVDYGRENSIQSFFEMVLLVLGYLNEDDFVECMKLYRRCWTTVNSLRYWDEAAHKAYNRGVRFKPDNCKARKLEEDMVEKGLVRRLPVEDAKLILKDVQKDLGVVMLSVRDGAVRILDSILID